MAKKKSKFYAVRNTNQIFENWSDCERVVKGTKGVEFKSFPTREQADAYLRGEDPVLSTNKTSEIVPYISESGIKGTIRMAEDSDPLTWGIDGFIYSIDGSFNAQTQTYGGAFACYENGVLLDAQAIANNKPQFAQSRNVAGEVCGFGLALSDAMERDLTKITIICDYEGIFRWSAPKSVKVNEVACWGVSLKKPVGRYHAHLLEVAKSSGIEEIDFIWVRGHRGLKINQTVDKLAKKVVGLRE